MHSDKLPEFDRCGPSRPMYPAQASLPDGTLLAARLTDDYYAVRDPLIQSRIELLRQGVDLATALSDLRARFFDDRVLEYLVFADWLLKREATDALLDVGCVLNNKLVSSLLPLRVRNLHLCNPARERLKVTTLPVELHVASLASAFPDGRQFQRVTCLSTIEHIGYDNSQYGPCEPARYEVPQVDTLLDSLRQLAALTAQGGELLVSTLYGFREVLVHPVTGKIGQQVFDHDALQQGMEVLRMGGMDAEVTVFEAFDTGWRRVAPETCHARYAQGCPAASAVAIISGRKIEGG